jgi:hypothetical protein
MKRRHVPSRQTRIILNKINILPVFQHELKEGNQAIFDEICDLKRCFGAFPRRLNAMPGKLLL